MQVFSIEYVLLAIQSALLREVTPQLRAMTVDLDHVACLLRVFCYYEGEVSEKSLDLWDCAISEGSTDLGPEFLLETRIERLDSPKEIPPGGYCAYLRKEPNAPSYKSTCPQVKMAKMSLGYAMLAVQHALLGVVTPELRAVVVDFDQEGLILYVRYYHDGAVPQDLINLWQSSFTEAARNFGADCILDGGVERIDYPGAIPFRGRFALFRKE